MQYYLNSISDVFSWHVDGCGIHFENRGLLSPARGRNPWFKSLNRQAYLVDSLFNTATSIQYYKTNEQSRQTNTECKYNISWLHQARMNLPGYWKDGWMSGVYAELRARASIQYDTCWSNYQKRRLCKKLYEKGDILLLSRRKSWCEDLERRSLSWVHGWDRWGSKSGRCSGN